MKTVNKQRVNRNYIPPWYTSLHEEDELDINFWAMFAVLTEQLASQIPNVTDSELRRRIAALRAQFFLENQKLEKMAETVGRLPAEIVRFSCLGEHQHEFAKTRKKMLQLLDRIEHIENVLYARLVMKDPSSVPAWLGLIFGLDPPDKTAARHRRRYPD